MEEMGLEQMIRAAKHPFENQKRISVKQTEELVLSSWSPPLINEAGHLVYAQTSAAPRRDAYQDETGGVGQEPTEARQGYDDGFRKGKEEGILAGKEAGLQQGKQDALRQAQLDLQPKLAELNKLLTSLSHSVNEEDYKLEQTLMQLVKHISEAVIRRELALDPSQLMKVIKETIAALPPNRDNIKILVSPADKQLVEDAISEGGENWRAVADESLSQGGVKIETDQSVADFSVEGRIQTVLDKLYEQQAICPKPGDPGYEEAPEPAVLAKAKSASGQSTKAASTIENSTIEEDEVEVAIVSNEDNSASQNEELSAALDNVDASAETAAAEEINLDDVPLPHAVADSEGATSVNSAENNSAPAAE